jgi:hypothetical protein
MREQEKREREPYRGEGMNMVITKGSFGFFPSTGIRSGLNPLQVRCGFNPAHSNPFLFKPVPTERALKAARHGVTSRGAMELPIADPPSSPLIIVIYDKILFICFD